MTRITFLPFPSPEVLTMTRQDPLVEPEPMLLLFQLLRSLGLIHSLPFYRGSLTSRRGSLQLSSLW